MKRLPRWLIHHRHRLVMGTLAPVVLAMAVALRPAPAAAHPLGNFTINRYSRLEFANDSVRITYVLDMAEIPTFQEMKEFDRDGDGQVSDVERDAYLATKTPQLVDKLRLVVGDDRVSLIVLDREASIQPGQGGLPILRIAVHLSGQLPSDWKANGTSGYTDRNYNDQIGWRELVVQGGPGVAIEDSSAPAVDQSAELRNYQTNSLSSAPNMAEATFTLVPDDGSILSGNTAISADKIKRNNSGGTATARVTALVTVKELTPTVVIISLLAALFWGAVHALTPGHGKTIVAAYLVGARGTARHAAFLGLTVTVTHTAGVFALGLVTLYLSRYILPETLYPWLGVASGALVVGMGVTLASARLRAVLRRSEPEHHHAHGHEPHDHQHPHAHGALEHSHDGHTHSHLPLGRDGGVVTWRSLLALGVSGGLIPCPSALILLLGAIALHRLEFGIVLVIAFSVGLAGVLTGVGLLLVYARRVFNRFSMEMRVPRVLPVASALIISIAGVALVLGSLGKTGVI